MGYIALVRCVLALRCGLAGVVWYPDAGWSTASACIRPSVRMKQLGCHWAGFYEIEYLCIFRKSVGKINFNYKITRITGTVHEDQNKVLIVSHLFVAWEIKKKLCTGNQNTRFVFANPAVYVIMENAGHRWHCVLDTSGYKHTPKICNTYCYCTATVIELTRLSVTLYVQYIACPVTLHIHFFPCYFSL